MNSLASVAVGIVFVAIVVAVIFTIIKWAILGAVIALVLIVGGILFARTSLKGRDAERPSRDWNEV